MSWKQQAYQMSMEGKNAREIANELGLNYNTVRQAIRRERDKQGTKRDCKGQPISDFKKHSSTSYDKGITTFEDVDKFTGDITPESIMKEKGLKVEEWEVVSFTKNTWQSQVKGGTKLNLYQSKLSVKPKKQKELTLDDLTKFFDTKQFKHRFELEPIKYNKSDEVLEIDMADLHCGLLAWNPETGNDYDLHICAKQFLRCIQDIVDRSISSKREFSEIYFCSLGDILHVDNDNNTTTKGTVQQADGRLPKIFDFTFDIIHQAIDMLRPLCAKTHYIYLCGNHDRNMGYALAFALKIANPDIDFDIAPNPQKTIHFGNVIVGLTHGNMSKANKGSWVLADSGGKITKKCFIEEHDGHEHTETARIINGVMVKGLLAQCAASYWEHGMGYRSKRGMMCFVWNKKSGLRDTWYYYY